MFIDRVTLKLFAGKGGNGIVAWRREKSIRKGGPAGGNGGRGGSVIIQADEQIHALEYYRNRRLLRAEKGQQGGTRNRTGKKGQELIVKVPCGTLVKDPNTAEILCDFTEHLQEWTACEGGIGGKGNVCFKSATNRTPNNCTLGLVGGVTEVELELKIIADVGLVGFPNAGKSTLISVLSNVRVKIAAYPFTTLRPNLGQLEFDDYSRILIADIPGIIKGAHNNRGLGFEFLRHIERTKVLIFVLDASGIDGRLPLDDFIHLREEIKAYKQNLSDKPFLVLLNKIDSPESEDNIKIFKEQYPYAPETLFEVSALEKQGIAPFIKALHKEFIT